MGSTTTIGWTDKTHRGIRVVAPQMVYDFQNLSLVSLFRSHVVKAYQVLADASTH